LAVADVSAVVAAMATVVVVVAFKEGAEVGTSATVVAVVVFREEAGAVGALAEEHRRVLRIQGSTLQGSMGQAKSNNGIYTSSI
jgi:hypothetical protein